MFPKPPRHLLETIDPHFEPSHELREWAFESFVRTHATLWNPDHEHLIEANILFLWASYPEIRNQQQVAGTAECYKPKEKRWSDGRQSELIRSWNDGEDPNFIITLSAPYAQEATPEAICALVEHELYHCGQIKSADGEPKFVGGQPIYGLRGHDVEEFVGIVARYGAYNTALKRMQDAFGCPPSIKRIESERAVCGCGAEV